MEKIIIYLSLHLIIGLVLFLILNKFLFKCEPTEKVNLDDLRVCVIFSYFFVVVMAIIIFVEYSEKAVIWVVEYSEKAVIWVKENGNKKISFKNKFEN